MYRFAAIIALVFSFFPTGLMLGGSTFVDTVSACEFNPNYSSIGGALAGCEPKGSIDTGNSGGWTFFSLFWIGTSAAPDYTVAGGVKNKIIRITGNIVILGSLLAIGAIVYSSIHFLTAHGDEGKLKQAKHGIIMALVGFLVMLVASPIVNAMIQLIFQVGK